MLTLLCVGIKGLSSRAHIQVHMDPKLEATPECLSEKLADPCLEIDRDKQT